MFITGQVGCSKSTTMEAAQHYCHSFCSAIATAFNKNFIPYSNNGLAAAIFGGTTIHSAAHSNKIKINDWMRDVWQDDVRITDNWRNVFLLGKRRYQSRQTTEKAHRKVWCSSWVSVFFSGDFHQLKPICTEEDVLFSNSDAPIWENTTKRANNREKINERVVGPCAHIARTHTWCMLSIFVSESWQPHSRST